MFGGPASRMPSYMYSDQYTGFSPQGMSGRGRGASGFGSYGSVIPDPGYNTSDPNLLHARVFVGKLDTSKATRDMILQKYSCFGTILGLTVFKGYAFVQYGSYEEAINAVHGTNQTMLAGQSLDVKLASESQGQGQTRTPAQKQKQNAFGGTNLTLFSSGAPQAKKLKKDSGAGATGARQLLSVPVSKPIKAAPATIQDETGNDELNRYAFPDTLICGNCREVFTDWVDFRDHRKKACSCAAKLEDEPDQVFCFVCKEGFARSWRLLTHLTKEHNLQVYSTDGGTNGVAKLEDVQSKINEQASE